MKKRTIVITTANESHLLRKCLKSIEEDINTEVLVVAPDVESEKVAKEFKCKYIKDQGKGKIAALNLSLKHAKGKFILFTDGDCELNNEELLFHALETDKRLGLVTGKVVPAKEKISNKWDFFHFFLLSAADYIRKKKSFKEVSAYMMAVRRELFKEFPYDVAEDSWLSTEVDKQGFDIGYIPKATVKVKGPQNVKDWVSQKTRTALAHERQQGKRIKTLKNEIFEGLRYTIKVHKYHNKKEILLWLPQLYVLRGYIWAKAKFKYLLGNQYKDGWQPVKSTKE